MAYRIPIDANLIGYWGFDEALETDSAIDESGNALHLTVSNSPDVQSGRVGNARSFDGATSFALLSHALLRITGDLTLITWVKMASTNGTGSTLRTIVSAGPPGDASALLYGLHVDSSGRLVYKHDSPSGVVVVRTAAGVIRTGQFYNIVLRRVDAGGGTQDVEFFVDNTARAVADVTVNGSPSALPIPAPTANAAAEFAVGRSRKEADSAFWDGLVDEVSVHDMARTYQPYIRSTYFSTTASNTTGRLTSSNSIKNISSY